MINGINPCINWYRLAQEDFSEFLKTFRPTSLMGLAAEALKAPNYEKFERNYSMEIKHGTYWHITDDPNFQIDLAKGPRDMSSLAAGEMTPGALMVTSHLENWLPYYPTRKYVAEIDLSAVDMNDYYQVKRGFGNEFYVKNPALARVVKVLPVAQALKIDRYRHAKIPQSEESLREFYEKVMQSYQQFTARKNETQLV